jgi:hypothetical protein
VYDRVARFSNQNSRFGQILEDLAIKDVNIYTYIVDILSILRPFDIFCVHVVYFVVIWYILWSFGIFFPVLENCTKKKLATLVYERARRRERESFADFFFSSDKNQGSINHRH